MSKLTLVGKRFSRLLVIAKAEYHVNPNGEKVAKWLCVCDCGKEVKVRTFSLNSGNTKSCGCWHKEAHLKHGMIKDVVYKTWCWMLGRCNNPNDKRFGDYGGRGIKVWEKWYQFENFYVDMGNRPDGCSLDRIDVNGNYEPGNCRWATQKEQSRNKRTNRLIEFNGDTKCLSEWAEMYGITNCTLRYRLESGWSIEKALTTLVRKPLPTRSNQNAM